MPPASVQSEQATIKTSPALRRVHSCLSADQPVPVGWVMDIPRFVVCVGLGPLRSALLAGARASRRHDRGSSRGVMFLTYKGI
jgi:hypothetical protein